MPQYAQGLEEKIGHEKLPVGWPWRLLLVTGGLFFVAFFGYFGMAFGYSAYLNSRIADLNNETANLAKVIPESERQSFIGFYSQITNIQELIKSRAAASQFLAFFESNSVRKIRYVTFVLATSENYLKLEGSAESYGMLAQQLEAFRRAPAVERVVLDSSILEEGGTVKFAIGVYFKKGAVK
ncbi:MAG: hypothetical protein HZA37_01800 [Parcubacteria group bacterium]|nr:hypothetical protein [Parcubacteria group bacterium]